MVWVAIDRALIMAKRGNLPIDEPRWTELRARVHDEILRSGFDPVRNTFTQSYGSHELDASGLLLVILGFLPPDDPRLIGTVDKIAEALYDDQYVYRYTTDEADGIRKEGSFNICGFWLVKAYAMMGLRDEAESLFVRLLKMRTTSACSPKSSVPSRRLRSETTRKRSRTRDSSKPPARSMGRTRSNRSGAPFREAEPAPRRACGRASRSQSCRSRRDGYGPALARLCRETPRHVSRLSSGCRKCARQYVRDRDLLERRSLHIL